MPALIWKMLAKPFSRLEFCLLWNPSMTALFYRTLPTAVEEERNEFILPLKKYCTIVESKIGLKR